MNREKRGTGNMERRSRTRGRAGFVWSLLSLVLLVGPLVGQADEPSSVPLTPEQRRTANEAMAQLRSPVTPFHTVDMCPSVPALRDSIRFAAATGLSTEAIVEDVIARHGEQVRLLPKRRGVGLLAWLIPPLAVLVGGALLVRRLNRSRAAAAAFPVPEVEVSDSDRLALSAAMREMEAAEEVEA